MFIYNGSEIDISKMQLIGDNQYPPEWLADPAARAELGIVEIDGAPPAVGPDQVATRGAIELDGQGAWVQRWLIADLTAEEIAERDAAAARALADLRLQLAASVDSSIAAIYNRWMRFEAEYVARETAARAFAADGYEGECSGWITSFATPAGLSLQVAADRIITQADSLRSALQQLGELRMQKYLILGAADEGAARAACAAITSQAAAIEAGL